MASSHPPKFGSVGAEPMVPIGGSEYEGSDSTDVGQDSA